MSPIVTFQIYKLVNFALIPNILPVSLLFWLSPYLQSTFTAQLSLCSLQAHVWYTNEGEHDFKWNVYLLSLPLDDPNSIFIGGINFLSEKKKTSSSVSGLHLPCILPHLGVWQHPEQFLQFVFSSSTKSKVNVSLIVRN